MAMTDLALYRTALIPGKMHIYKFEKFAFAMR